MNWMWSWPETVAVVNDTFGTMLGLLDEFPGFVFSQSQASTYRLIERYNPAMFETIRRRVREGRWEVTASQWVEGDKNMVSGESLCRHLLYTRRYFQDRFGLAPEDVQVDFEPDTFGHPATLPTILVRGGVRYYYHCRGSRGPHLYWWVGPDGSRVLALSDVSWYMGAIEPQIADPLIAFCRATGLKAMPVLYGVGDHGGGPTRRDLQRLVEMQSWPVFPRLAFSTLHHFFRLAEREAGDIPQIVGERNVVFPGCYTSQARQKWANRHGENLLYTAEVAATLGDRIAGVAYPRDNLGEAWKGLLFSQFHDILPGSGVRETREYALGHAQDSQAAAAMARTNALRALGRRVDTASLRRSFTEGMARADKDAAARARSMGAGVGYATGAGGESAVGAAQVSDRVFLVFNPLPYPRRGVVEARLWNAVLDEDRLVVTSEGNAPQRVQVLGRDRYWGHEGLTVAFPVEVPAMGYRAVCVSDRATELGVPVDETRDVWTWLDDESGAQRVTPVRDDTLENECLRVQLDPPSGGIVSLVDKRSGREWVPGGRLAGVLQYGIEADGGMSAWIIGQFLRQEELLQGGALERVQRGPHLQTLRWQRPLGNSRLTLDVSLRRGVPRVEFRLRVDWREMGSPERGIPHLRVRFPLAVRDAQPRYEVPFGAVRRDLFDGQEVPALRWVDLSEANGEGVTLVNTSKYGFGLNGDTLHMTLLRATVVPDPLPDLGEHVIEYALEPHGAGWSVGDSMRMGEEANVPLVVAGCGFHDGDLPGVAPFVEVENGNVRLVALKKAEDGRAFILRLVEVEGRETEARVAFSSALLGTGAVVAEVDTLEHFVESNRARLCGDTLLVQVAPFGVTTVRVGG